MTAAMAFLLLLPRNLCVAVLTAYRLVISPLYGDVCRYYPSCSRYTMQAIQQHGVVKGVWLGTRRIVRCHPWAEGGIDDVPDRSHDRYAVTRLGFVVADRHTSAHYLTHSHLAHSHGKG